MWNRIQKAGKYVLNGEKTVTCEVCGVQLFESNMHRHRATCMSVIAGVHENGRPFYECKRCDVPQDGVIDTNATWKQTPKVTCEACGVQLLGNNMRQHRTTCMNMIAGKDENRSLFSSGSSATDQNVLKNFKTRIHTEIIRECPHCNIKMLESEMMIHIKSCAVTLTGTDSNGQFFGTYIGHVSQTGLGIKSIAHEIKKFPNN